MWHYLRAFQAVVSCWPAIQHQGHTWAMLSSIAGKLMNLTLLLRECRLSGSMISRLVFDG